MKNNRFKIIATSIILIIIISLVASIDLREFSNITIDELIEDRYSKYDCEYIEDDNYYLIIGYKKGAFSGFDEIVHYNSNNEYVFFEKPPVPIMLKFKKLDIDYAVTSFKVYKNNNEYVMFVWEGFPDDNLSIYDNDKTWASIDALKYGTKYWLNVEPELDDDYQIVIENDGEIIRTITKEDIVALFD